MACSPYVLSIRKACAPAVGDDDEEFVIIHKLK
jgi:hypothetical protein